MENAIEEWEILTNSVVVKPVGDDIFSERATYVSIEDEGAGPFLIIKQNNSNVEGEIRIDVEEWEHIRKATDTMIERCKYLNVTKKKRDFNEL